MFYRNGKFELNTGEEEEKEKEGNSRMVGEEEEESILQLKWSQLLEPRLVCPVNT